MSDLMVSVSIPGTVWAWLASEFGLDANATLHEIVTRHREEKARAEQAEAALTLVERYGAEQWRLGNKGADPEEFSEWQQRITRG